MFWIFAIAITLIASAALYYAARPRPVNATSVSGDDAVAAHFRLQLKEIDADLAAGRLAGAEAEAARAELARELIRSQGENAGAAPRRQAWAVPAAIVLTAVMAIGTYAWLGNPGLPAQPLAERGTALDDALGRIEAQLEKTPDDVRGWAVIAPVYMQQGRFADAERALRRVIELQGPTADLETDLGEAVMMQQGGSAEGEPLALFESAAARDPAHVRSRFYLASAATTAGEFQTAIARWTALIAMGSDADAWMATAKAGLAAAEAGLNGGQGLPDDAAIRGMVDGLAERLYASGGSIEEWTRLVRSRLVLGQTAEAQKDYETARTAYPDAAARQELDVLAADNGLTAGGSN